MSAVIVLTPVAVAAWPAVAAAVTAAVASSRFRVAAGESASGAAEREIELEVANVEVLEETLEGGAPIVVEGDGVRVAFSTDPEGRLKTCVSGDLGDAQLRAIGHELAGRVVQQYVYRRLSEALEAQGFVAVDDDRDTADTIHLHLRRWDG